MNPKYLTQTGQFRIGNLFYETTNKESIYAEDSTRPLPIFTLKDHDITMSGVHLKSMSKMFLEYNDITGYKFAVEVLGSYEHFELLGEHKIIGKAIESWKEELKIRLDSLAVNAIKDIIKEGGTQVQLSAAKFIANREYETKGPVGKPATNNKSRKAETHAKAVSIETSEELERLGLH